MYRSLSQRRYSKRCNAEHRVKRDQPVWAQKREPTLPSRKCRHPSSKRKKEVRCCMDSLTSLVVIMEIHDQKRQSGKQSKNPESVPVILLTRKPYAAMPMLRVLYNEVRLEKVLLIAARDIKSVVAIAGVAVSTRRSVALSVGRDLDAVGELLGWRAIVLLRALGLRRGN